MMVPSVRSSLLLPPPEEVEIRLDQVEEIATQTVAYLRAQKVEIIDLDIETIKDVTNWQVYAKVTRARWSSPFDDGCSEDSLVERICTHFRQSLKPTAALVKHVGRFEHGGKTFYPKVAHPNVTSNVPAGYVAAPVTVGARRLYIRPVEGQPLEDLARHPELLTGIPVERLHWSEGATTSLSLTQVIKSYKMLLHRVRRKIPQLLIDVDLTSSKGTAAQLVGTRLDSPFCHEQLAWSKLTLPASVLRIGAGFGFGKGSNDYWHRYEGVFSVIRADVTRFAMEEMFELSVSDSEESDKD